MRILQRMCFIIAVVVVTGCAHPMVISPDISKIERDNTQPIDKNVGYYMAPDAREKAVTTPGGGGDMVTYQPYKDIEAGFYKMLSNVFKNVTVLKSSNDAATISKQSISYVITPVIATNSSSSSILTWPPTRFTVTLTCNIADSHGKPVTIISVTGEGQAEFDEFKHNFSLSGERAAQDALLKMQRALLNAPDLRN
ncbi:MAG TPA: hypothetical protein VLV32_04240 [Burkholderiales bacterium]|nr:hypothetical protein [Burkholderiales bacterium]